MPIVKNTLIGDSQGASAQVVAEIPITLTAGATINTQTFRIKGLPNLAFQIEVTGGTCPNITAKPQASIQVDGTGALRFFDLNAGVIVPNGGFQLLQFTVPVDYVRVNLSVGAGVTATGFVRILASG